MCQFLRHLIALIPGLNGPVDQSLSYSQSAINWCPNQYGSILDTDGSDYSQVGLTQAKA